jgi:hypothetical protein
VAPPGARTAKKSYSGARRGRFAESALELAQDVRPECRSGACVDRLHLRQDGGLELVQRGREGERRLVRHHAAPCSRRNVEVRELDQTRQPRVGPRRAGEVGHLKLRGIVVYDGAARRDRNLPALRIRGWKELDAQGRVTQDRHRVRQLEALAREARRLHLEHLRSTAASDAVAHQQGHVARQQLAAQLCGEVVGDAACGQAQESGTVQTADHHFGIAIAEGEPAAQALDFVAR